MRARKVWVVVANASRAKIFEQVDAKTLKEIKTLEHQASRTAAHDLVSDKPGRAGPHKGGGPHFMDQKMPPKLAEKEHFAEEMARYLHEEHKSGHFERLHVIGSVPFIALLKEHSARDVVETIETELHKDLTLSSPQEIRDHLPPVL